MPILVLGVHRSGTSLIMSCLSKNGLFIGKPHELLEPSINNQNGLYEYKKIVLFNNDLLEKLGGSWHKPPKAPVKFNGHLGLVKRANEIINYFSAQRKDYGFKDPRLTILYPFWRQVLPVNHKVIIGVRRPREVILSLTQRDGRSYEYWEEIWLQYMRRCLKYTEKANRHFVFYEDFFRDDTAIERLLNFCELPSKHPSGVLDQLKHHDAFLKDSKADVLYKNLYITHHLHPEFS